MSIINPKMMEWAREEANLSLSDAARKLGIKDSKTKSAVDKLAELEDGTKNPSRRVLLEMVKKYRRCLLTFYLRQPPRKGDRGQDFRMLPYALEMRNHFNVDSLIRDIRSRQDLAKSLVEDEEFDPLDFVGSVDLNYDIKKLSAIITGKIGFDINIFRSRKPIEQAFKYLRTCIENVGIFVVLVGNLGSHHTNFSVDDFRGIAVADKLAPFIVINDRDTKKAWSFTAFHELVHIWLGATCVSGNAYEEKHEKFCNDVAGELLLPNEDLKELDKVGVFSVEETAELLDKFASERNISRAMVAYKLYRCKYVTRDYWLKLGALFRKEWELGKKKRLRGVSSDSGPNYYVVKRHKLGVALLGLARRSLHDGALSSTKAGFLLGVKPRNVQPLLKGAAGGGSL